MTGAPSHGPARAQAARQPTRRPDPLPNGNHPNGSLSLAVPPELIEAIAEQVAELLSERQARPEDGWLRGAEQIGAYIGAEPDRVYALSSAGRIPLHRDGSALLAKRSELDTWVRKGGGKRP